MSPKKPVTTLNQKCLKVVYNKLIYTIADEDAKAYIFIKNYLTRTALHNLLKRILSSEKVDECIRFNCLQLLITDGARELETGTFRRYYYDKILKVTYDYGRRLQHLSLKGVWARDFPEQLSKLLRRLTELRSLHIPKIANDEVIDAVLSLEKLVLLDISGEPCYTANGLRNLKMDHLQELYIGIPGNYSVCQEEEQEEEELDIEEDSDDELKDDEEEELDDYEDNSIEQIRSLQTMADLLENLPDLVHLHTYSYTGGALSMLRDRLPKYKTKLKYVHDTDTTNDIITSIISLCPDLEELNLEGADDGVLEKLQDLKDLRELQLTTCYLLDLPVYLKNAGAQLRTLKLVDCGNVMVDMSQISSFAPNLKTIEFSMTRVGFGTATEIFEALENVILWYCNVNSDTVHSILKHSPLLKLLHVTGSSITLVDSDMYELCFEYNLKNIEKLWFSTAKSLGAATVEYLIENCPNLIEIGDLSGWDVNREEVLDLRALITTKNLDVILLPK